MNDNNTNAFIDGLKNELDSTLTETEKGALAYETAGGEGKNLVDFNFAITQMRNWDEAKIQNFFSKVYYDNPMIALRYWAFCADVRGGLGERRTSRAIFKWLIDNQINEARKLLKLIPEYGRWDSLSTLIDSKLRSDVAEIVKNQLELDLVACREHKPFSLCAKWMPSLNTSSKSTRSYAKNWIGALEISPKQYRKMLSELRAGLKVIESKMSSNKWGEIDYNAVPSKANLVYKNAFLKHDELRRKEYLGKLANGDKDVKINSSVAFPCDIVHKYQAENYRYGVGRIREYDETLEQMWNALPDYVKGAGKNTLVVADTSGSMMSTYGLTNMSAWSVAQSLAIYFSQRASGPFKDKYIMFSSSPFWVDFSNCKTLRDRLVLSDNYNECSTTDFYKTMKLILDTAVNNNLSQEDIPSSIVVVSDMQFDVGARYDKALMDEISEEFKSHGYLLPKMVYWNVCGGFERKSVVPMQKNENGVILLSGFSATLMGMALSGEVSPYKVLVEKLKSNRYDAVENALGPSAT